MMRLSLLISALSAFSCSAMPDSMEWEQERLQGLSGVEYCMDSAVHLIRDVYAVYTPQEWVGLRVVDVVESGEFKRWIAAVETEGYKFTGQKFELYGPNDAYLFEKVQ